MIVLAKAKPRSSARWSPLAIVVLLAALAGAMLLTACGDNDEQPQPAAAPQHAAQPDEQQVQQEQPAQPRTAEALANLEGEIAVDGSSTVFPITEAMAEEFGILTVVGVDRALA